MAGLLNEFYGRGPEAMTHYAALAGRAERLPRTAIALLAGGYHRAGKSAEIKTILEGLQSEGRNALRDQDDYVHAFSDPRTFPRKVTAEIGLAEAIFMTAQSMLGSGSNGFFMQLAVLYGQTALYLDPEHMMARWVIGMAASQGNSTEAANAILASVRKTDPGYVQAHMQIANNLERMGRKADALAKLQALARERSDSPDIQMELGDLLRRDEKFQAAAEAYDRAFAMFPDSDPENWIMYYTRGMALERAKQWPRAEADFRKALALKPDEPSISNYLGYSWLDRNENLDEARRLIEAAYKLRPDDGAIVDSLGWALYLNGEYEKAVVQPSDSTINCHLGDALWKVGRRNEARFQWRRAISLSTDEAEKTALRGKLDQGLAQN
jgi:Flp pilus assembly protein TadD